MFTSSKSFKLFRVLVIISAMLALGVVALGAYVRLSDAGLGCPDWPGCYGTLTVPQSEAAISNAQTAYPTNTIVLGKVVASTLGAFFCQHS